MTREERWNERTRIIAELEKLKATVSTADMVSLVALNNAIDRINCWDVNQSLIEQTINEEQEDLKWFYMETRDLTTEQRKDARCIFENEQLFYLDLKPAQR